MSLHLLLKGLAIGFSIAAPVGPIGLLCIRRAIAEGQRAGFICGLGAATADAVYALSGGFAMTALARWLVQQRLWFAVAGGAFLIYLGLRTMAMKASCAVAAGPGRGAMSAYSSTLLLTLANPMTIMSFAAVFAGLGMAAAASYSAAATLVAGVFAGSALWWLLLSGVAGQARRHISAALMQTINRCCGLVIAAFGCYAIADAVMHHWGHQGRGLAARNVTSYITGYIPKDDHEQYSTEASPSQLSLPSDGTRNCAIRSAWTGCRS